KAGEKVPDKKDGDKPSRDSGWVDLGRVKVSIQPAAEFRQMFQEAWRLQGELETSHAYEMGGEYRKGPDYRQGFLGVDWEFDADSGGYRITHIARGDVWDPNTTSP